MHSSQAIRRSEDTGLALVVALLVTMISFIIVMAVLAQAFHNVSQSGYMRKRLSAVSAAEAGLNWYWRRLETATISSLKEPGGWAPNVTTVPNGTTWEYVGYDVASKPDSPAFKIQVAYLASNPCVQPSNPTKPRTCSIENISIQDLNQNPFPSTIYAIVRSTGCVGLVKDCWAPDPKTSVVRRSLQTVMRLRTRYGGVSGSVTSSYVCLDQAGKLTMSGDLYVLGSTTQGPTGWPEDCKKGVVVGSGDALNLTGSLYSADGDLSLDDGADSLQVTGSIWASGSVTLGDGVSTALACSDSTIKYCVQGSVTGSSVSVGSKSVVLGDLMECNPACPPPTNAFPKIVWNTSDWNNWQQVEVNQTSLTSSSSPLTVFSALGNPLSRTVYHITGANCVVDLNGRFTINVDVAIVGECRFEMNSQTAFSGTGTLLLMSLWPGTPGNPADLSPSLCAGTSVKGAEQGNGFTAGPRDVYMHNNPQTAGPNFFVYTPCSLKIDNNQNPVKGQLVARFLWIKNQANVTLVSVSGGGGIDVPGIVSGFSQDVRYINEIPVTTPFA